MKAIVQGCNYVVWLDVHSCFLHEPVMLIIGVIDFELLCPFFPSLPPSFPPPVLAHRAVSLVLLTSSVLIVKGGIPRSSRLSNMLRPVCCP